jgi:AcrR family transcriptional regulator
MDKAVFPKRRDRVQTRAKILAAAQQAFAEIGYQQAGIRDIAARAGVTSPMLLHYFGSKLGLFEAALIDSMDNDALFEAPKEGFGRYLMEQLSNRALEIRTPALIALSTGDEEARAVTARVALKHAVGPLAKWLGPPNGHARAVQISMLAISYILFTRQVPLLAPESEPDRDLTKRMADTIQAIVDEGIPSKD